MLRTLAAFAVSAFLAATASADPLDDLFAAAQAGDSQAVDALFISAESAQLRRDMMVLLSGSHAALRSFTRSWAEAEPDNPAALTARAWSRYREAYLIRGENSIDLSWPPALERAQPLFDEAFDLAARALALDPTFLPASDAVILIGRISGDILASEAEIERVLSAAPNRHSLVLAAAMVRSNWLGKLEVRADLCDSHASALSDAPGYTAEMCLIEAIFISTECCSSELEWATEQIGAYVDGPLMDKTVRYAADEDLLAPEAADRLRARLRAEGRLTVKAYLAGRSNVMSLQYPEGSDPLPDLADLRTALERDLVAANLAADRDPGNPHVLEELAYLHGVASALEKRETGFFQVPPPDDIVDRIMAVAERDKARLAEMSARALTLVRLSPLNSDALLFGGHYVHDRHDDPIDQALWNHALFTNAILYANYRYDIVGEYLFATKYERSQLQREAAEGRAKTYDDQTLTEVFDCPYIRALRLFESSCTADGAELDGCYQLAGLWREAEFSDPESAYVRAQASGTCQAEREGPLESLRYQEIDLKL